MDAFWAGLTEVQRTIVIIGGVGIVWGVLWSYVRYGTDYSGVGEYIRRFLP